MPASCQRACDVVEPPRLKHALAPLLRREIRWKHPRIRCDRTLKLFAIEHIIERYANIVFTCHFPDVFDVCDECVRGRPTVAEKGTEPIDTDHTAPARARAD